MDKSKTLNEDLGTLPPLPLFEDPPIDGALSPRGDPPSTRTRLCKCPLGVAMWQWKRVSLRDSRTNAVAMEWQWGGKGGKVAGNQRGLQPGPFPWG